MVQWGIFNDESANYTESEAVEAGFYSQLEARKAIAERYSDDDDLTVQRIEETDEDYDDDE